jgi:EAL domain-containing protein (putative c-di-GMP-specific phosphodiesterase class I)
MTCIGLGLGLARNLIDKRSLSYCKRPLRNGCYCKIALDNFGTSYSSLSHFRRFKVDQPKLDWTSALNVEINESVAVVRAGWPCALAGLETVAERIESGFQERVPLGAGCDAVQGHLHPRPLFADYLRDRSIAAALTPRTKPLPRHSEGEIALRQRPRTHGSVRDCYRSGNRPEYP